MTQYEKIQCIGIKNTYMPKSKCIVTIACFSTLQGTVEFLCFKIQQKVIDKLQDNVPSTRTTKYMHLWFVQIIITLTLSCKPPALMRNACPSYNYQMCLKTACYICFWAVLKYQAGYAKQIFGLLLWIIMYACVHFLCLSVLLCVFVKDNNVLLLPVNYCTLQINKINQSLLKYVHSYNWSCYNWLIPQ